MRLEYFLLIDRVVSLDLKAGTIVCESTVPTESPVFEGHFPRYPLLPGVMMIETMAQCAGWFLVAMNRFQRMPFLAAVRDAKFRSFVKPGKTLIAEAKRTHDGSGYAMMETTLSCEGRIVCNGTITFHVAPFPSPDFETEMRERAASIGLLGHEALADG
ncbi:MAG TPA: 3-hydroxyacyl-ACP dehydratase FabZ family protein [Pseudolabrys sp.]|nr:3-hydroxyacyl-ACP dehydratase FabZ family protein [Pseudolabrys sp.]